MIDSLTLDQMRILVAVADAGSFSAAARKLGRVQSAISQSIQTLETTLGLVLFDRSGKTPQLTDAGKALVGDARALIAGARAIRARAQSMAEESPNATHQSPGPRVADQMVWPSKGQRSPVL